MFRFILQLLLYVVLFLVLRAIITKLFSPSQSGKITPRPHQSEPSAGGELKRDPVCGTYVSAAGSITRTIKGETIYFCSPECRDKYLVC